MFKTEINQVSEKLKLSESIKYSVLIMSTSDIDMEFHID
jgi:hypothetical protein